MFLLQINKLVFYNIEKACAKSCKLFLFCDCSFVAIKFHIIKLVNLREISIINNHFVVCHSSSVQDVVRAVVL